MEDGQVEDDERQLKRHAKADHKEQLHVDVVLQIGQRRSDGRGLADEPLKACRDDDEVAKDCAQEEQHRRGEHRGHDPLALVGSKRRQEKRQNLPDDHGRAHDHGHLDGQREAQAKAAERGSDVELTVRHKGADGIFQDVEHNRRGEIQHDSGGKHRHDHDGQAATELSQVIEERHTRRSDRHYSSPPFGASAAAASSSASSSRASWSTTALRLRGRRA